MLGGRRLNGFSSDVDDKKRERDVPGGGPMRLLPLDTIMFYSDHGGIFEWDIHGFQKSGRSTNGTQDAVPPRLITGKRGKPQFLRVSLRCAIPLHADSQLFTLTDYADSAERSPVRGNRCRF